MKTNLVSKASGLITATTLLLGTVSVQAGFLQILKGDQENKCECEKYQRVAFVGSAQVKEVKGKVEFLSGVNKWSQLSSGKTLKPGDLVRTSTGSRAILKMTDSGSLVSVTPATILRLVPFEKEWSPAILTGDTQGKGYVVRALRGEAEFQSEAGWQKLSMQSEVAPGSKIRLVSGQQVDLYSREHGMVRLSAKGETILPGAGQPVARQLKTTPVVAASVRN
jgi:hypothetical protein